MQVTQKNMLIVTKVLVTCTRSSRVEGDVGKHFDGISVNTVPPQYSFQITLI
jgi:hypothetical protein